MCAKNKNVRLKRSLPGKCTVRRDTLSRSSRYNYTEMEYETELAQSRFSIRLSQLRLERNISAREMSLSLGQGAAYINNIENGRNLPSMSMFFEICEFLRISPGEFFAYTKPSSSLQSALLREIEKLDNEDQRLLLSIVNRLGGKEQ